MILSYKIISLFTHSIIEACQFDRAQYYKSQIFPKGLHNLYNLSLLRPSICTKNPSSTRGKKNRRNLLRKAEEGSLLQDGQTCIRCDVCWLNQSSRIAIWKLIHCSLYNRHNSYTLVSSTRDTRESLLFVWCHPTVIFASMKCGTLHCGIISRELDTIFFTLLWEFLRTLCT